MPFASLVRLAVLIPALLLVPGCDRTPDSGVVQIDVIGAPAELRRPLDAARRPAGQVMLGATAQGLLAFDSRGELLPALAESWIVADEGRSLIFRLRTARWPDDSPVKATEVAAILRKRMAASPRVMAGFAPDIRAMTERVIEVRLDVALPSFLQLLAHPAMAIQRSAAASGTGPYRPTPQGQSWLLTPAVDPISTGEDELAEEIDPADLRSLRAVPAPLGVTRFMAGRTDALLGGRFQDLPLLAISRLPTTIVRADPVAGLFGLAVTTTTGPLADRTIRTAIAASLDREGLARNLGLAGWSIGTAILPASLDLGRAPTVPEWTGLPLAERRAAARLAVARWREAEGAPPPLRIALPAGSGARLLFFRLQADLRTIGLSARMVGDEAKADLHLIDEVAPIDSALWYLTRIDCAQQISCDESASYRLADAHAALSPGSLSAALSQAELLATRHVGYIPLGQPIRWSLVAPRLNGFAPSPRGRHPLNGLVLNPK